MFKKSYHAHEEPENRNCWLKNYQLPKKARIKKTISFLPESVQKEAKRLCFIFWII